MVMTGVVLSIVGGVYRVLGSAGVVDAFLRGRKKHRSDQQVLVGDRVQLLSHDDGAVTIEEIEPRETVLRRRRPGGARGIRNVAANMSQVIVVGSADQPRWHNAQVDRFLAVAEANGLPAVLVVNKIDLVGEEELPGHLYRTIGYRVLFSSVPLGRGVAELREVLKDEVSLITGPTGVGKSSILNEIQPGLALRTGEISNKSRSGRHTTVGAEMHPLSVGGFVVDTPGLRDIGLWDVDPADVAAAFPEIERWAADCRFDDCRHVGEPDCGVQAGVEAGKIDPGRLDSYRVLLEEVEAASRRW